MSTQEPASALKVLDGVAAPPSLAYRALPKRRAQSPEELAQQVCDGSRAALSQAISLVESSRSEDREQADYLMSLVLPKSGNAVRVGITGVPGVGKSTLIEALGRLLLAKESEKVAVIAVDPTSPITHGSILGDKSRMGWLSTQDRAYVRPSPTGGSLGGVAARTREVIQLCEAWGCTTVIVETVGVGQSEVAVEGLVDCFLLLMLAGAGDEVQGIKKGVVEMADVIGITKADGDNVTNAKVARQLVLNALHLVGSRSGEVPVEICSSATGQGLPELWGRVSQFIARGREGGQFERRRASQGARWMKELVDEEILRRFYEGKGSTMASLAREVAEGRLTPRAAAERLLGS